MTPLQTHHTYVDPVATRLVRLTFGSNLGDAAVMNAAFPLDKTTANPPICRLYSMAEICTWSSFMVDAGNFVKNSENAFLP
jgi:hypothetical protein